MTKTEYVFNKYAQEKALDYPVGQYELRDKCTKIRNTLFGEPLKNEYPKSNESDLLKSIRHSIFGLSPEESQNTDTEVKTRLGIPNTTSKMDAFEKLWHSGSDKKLDDSGFSFKNLFQPTINAALVRQSELNNR